MSMTCCDRYDRLGKVVEGLQMGEPPRIPLQIENCPVVDCLISAGVSGALHVYECLLYVRDLALACVLSRVTHTC